MSNTQTPIPEDRREEFWEHMAPSASDPHWISEGDIADKHLVIWVHGFLGSPKKTFETLAPAVHRRLGKAYGFAAFAYPAGLFHQASYLRSGEDLRSILEKLVESPNPPSVISFVTHSTGGLVVKHALMSNRGADSKRECSDKLWEKVRNIVNFAVPHFRLTTDVKAITIGVLAVAMTALGWSAFRLHEAAMLQLGSRGVDAAWMKGSLGLLLCFAAVVLGIRLLAWFVNAVVIDQIFKTLGFRHLFHIGLNRIPFQLALPKSKLTAWDEAFVKATADAGIKNYDRQPSYDAIAHPDYPDGVARPRAYRNPDHHSTQLVVKYEEDEVIKLAAAPLAGPTPAKLERAMRGMVAVMTELDDRYGVTNLNGTPTKKGSQVYAHKQLEAEIADLRSDRLLVLEATAGMGKSSVLRALARSVGQQVVGDGGATKIVLWTPLYRFSMTEPYSKPLLKKPPPKKPFSDDDALLTVLRDFLAFGFTTVGVKGITGDDIDEWLSENAVCILDGLDDWELQMSAAARTCPALHRGMAERLVGALLNRYPYLQVVCGVRSGHVKQCLGSRAAYSLKLAPLSDPEVQKLLVANQGMNQGTADKLIDSVKKSSAVRELLFSPLFLERQGAIPAALVSGQITRGRIFDEVLKHRINSKLITRNQPQPEVIALEAAIHDAVTLVGHSFFSRNITFATEEVIRESVTAHLKAAGLQVGACEPQANRLLAAAQCLSDPQLASSLMDAGIFVPAQTDGAANAWRFEHPQWLEYCASRFLAWAVELESVAELSRRASLTRMFFTAGDCMESTQLPEVTERWVASALAFLTSNPPPELPGVIPLGNMLGTVGHSPCKIEPGAAKRLAALAQGKPKGDRLLTIVAGQTLSFRVLCDARRGVHSVLKEPVLEALDTHGPAFPAPPSWWGRCFGSSRSVSKRAHLCFAANLSRAAILGEGFDAPSRWQLDRIVRDALNIVWTAELNQTTKLNGEMQEVFVTLFDEALNEPLKALACVCYAPALVAGYRKKCLVHDITRDRVEELFVTKAAPRSDAARFRSILEEFEKSHGDLPLTTIWDMLCEDVRKAR